METFSTGTETLYVTERVIVSYEQRKIYCKLLSIIQPAVNIYSSHVFYGYIFEERYYSTLRRTSACAVLPGCLP